MIVRALRCRLAPTGDEPLAVEWWSGPATELQGAASAGAYVVTASTLAELKSEGFVNDRKRKHPRRPLSACLLGQPRIPIVFATFSTDRQVKNSIRTLLENAAAKRERKAYVIGVTATVFEQMGARVPPPTDDQTAKTTAQVHLFELLDPEEIPAALEHTLIGRSLDMQVVRLQIVRAAREELPVLILGDTGTGKELVARQIHGLNPLRCNQPFVPVNCGAIPSTLFENEVFGHVPGAFSGALKHGNEGLWRSARAGTVFLDEIGDLSLGDQVKILRVLQEKTLRPVGSATEVKLAARVVAATNRDLYAMTESGEFREDLYYRLASLVISVPPLRERTEDVPRLAERFWKKVAPNRPPLSSDVLRELGTYQWRGNARELGYIVMNLHTTFPKSSPTVDRLRAVVRLRAPGAVVDPKSEKDGSEMKIDRLRHLQRGRAAIDASGRLARRLGKESLDADERVRALAEIGGWLTELHLLGTRPERFERPATFELLQRLAGKVAVAQGLMATNAKDAARYMKQELVRDAAAAAAAVRRDEERILKSL